LTKQDERIRLRKRLFERAVEHATQNRWQEAVDDNLQLLELGREPDTLNRLGKAYLELGDHDKALEYYQETLQINPANVVARKNVARLEQLQKLEVIQPEKRTYADLSLFIVESGKTALTTLVNLAPDALAHVVIGEEVQIEYDDKNVWLVDGEGHTIGYLEPQLAQRLSQMIEGGNRYTVVVANLDARMVKVLIRETYRAPGQRQQVSFPGKLGGDIANFRTYRDLSAQLELETEDLLEDEELVEEETLEETEEDFFRTPTTGEEEIGLEELEANLSSDEDEEES
jgi:tetratricopeptide (TPR) repeat protein